MVDKEPSKAEKFLDSIPKFSRSGKSAANFNLDRMRAFCEKMGHPEKKFPSIHVGGTNGKGTVCRMLASVYQEAGYKVGLYTSPHLLDVKERFMINSKKADSGDLTEFLNCYMQYISHSNFTYFEVTTAFAFWYFEARNVDLAILEVGLGGRLDATNVVQPRISAITSVDLDHTDILGTTLASIAFEKAGIIKEETNVVVGDLNPEAVEQIASVARSKNSDILQSGSLLPEYKDHKIVLKGVSPTLQVDGKNLKKIDAQNVAIVFKIVETLNPSFPVSAEKFVSGIENLGSRFSKHAVFEKLCKGKQWYFDGAHNFQSIKALTEHLEEIAPASRWTVVLSFMKDKLNSESTALWRNFPKIFIYKMEGPRAANIEQMKKYFPNARRIKNIRDLYTDQFKSELVIFSGSFYFYNVVSNWMGTIASADQKNPPVL